MTADQLAESVGCSVVRAGQWLADIESAMADYMIDTPTRQAAFLAQIGHESGHLVYVKELWGPTPTQQRYENRTDLGNTELGDDFKFRGRGLIQITGRSNYAKCGTALGLPLLDHPEFLEQFKYAALSAAWYWDQHHLNELADNGEFEQITRRINGGLNGQPERLALWEAAKKALA